MGIRRRHVLGGIGGVLVLGAGAATAYATTRYTPGPPQRGVLALLGGTVLAGDRLEAIADAVVLIEDGRIVAVGPAMTVPVPPGAAALHVPGLTVLPGLIDLHVHLGSPDLPARAEPGLTTLPRLVADEMRFAPGHRRAALEHGVTAVRSLGDNHEWIIELRRQVRQGWLEGPRVYAAGPLFTARGGHPIATFGADPGSDLVRVPSNPAHARQMVAALADAPEPVDVIKVVQERGSPSRPLEPMAPAVLRAVVGEAHDRGLRVTAHWGTPDDLRDLLDAGVDGLEHVDARELLGGWPAGLPAELAQRGIPLTATLAISEAALPPAVMPEAMTAFRARIGEFHAAGGAVVVGTDAARPGVHFGSGVHRELELLVASGLTARQALQAATCHAARVLGDDGIGIVAPGRAADLLVVAGDPTSDVTACRNVVAVLRDGRLVVDRRGKD